MSCANDYKFGDSVVVDMYWYDLDGNLADPTTLTVQYQRQRRRPSDPAPAIVVYVAPDHITHIGTGQYRFISPPIIIAGTYDLEAAATGASVTKVLTGRFTVAKSVIE